MIDQLPADAIGIEIGDRLRRLRRQDFAVVIAKGDAGNGCERAARRQAIGKAPHRFLAFTAHENVECRRLGQNLPPVIGRKDAAIDDGDFGITAFDRLCDHTGCGMGRGRAGMADQHQIRVAAHRPADNLRYLHRSELGIDETDDMTVVDQRACDREKAERWKVIIGNATADRRMRRIYQNDPHCGFTLAGPPV